MEARSFLSRFLSDINYAVYTFESQSDGEGGTRPCRSYRPMWSHSSVLPVCHPGGEAGVRPASMASRFLIRSILGMGGDMPAFSEQDVSDQDRAA